MKRRTFIKLSGIGMSTIPVVNSFANPYSNKGELISNTPDVIVIGAGTFGVWTAYHLNRLGAKVTLLDAYGPGNSRASSGGETRLIQVDNDNSIYIRSAIRAYEWWKKIEEITGETIVLSTGRLSMSQKEMYKKTALARKNQLETFDIKNTEILDSDELRYRWPQIYSEDLAAAMYNSGGPSGSTLLARKGCQIVANQFKKDGGILKIAHGSPLINNGKIEGVKMQDGKTLLAQHYVFACGPWLPKVFPNLLLPRLKVERRDVIFVGTPSGDNRFSFPNLPEWGVQGSGFYGFPDIEGRGLKIASYPDYNSFDPDTDERLINLYQVKRAHDFAKQRFPALGDQPITESRVCQVTNSIDSNFIVDQLPENLNTWIIGAGSGHGFKHGPAVGEYAANRILQKQTDIELDKAFKVKQEVFQAK